MRRALILLAVSGCYDFGNLGVRADGGVADAALADLAPSTDGAAQPDLVSPDGAPMVEDLAAQPHPDGSPPDLAVRDLAAADLAATDLAATDLAPPPDLARSFGFAKAVHHNLGVGAQFPRGLAIGDYNGDGKPDVAVAWSSMGAGYVSVLLNAGGGNLGPAKGWSVSAAPQHVASFDANGDKVLDLLVASAGQGVKSATFLLGKGDGTFMAKSYPAVAEGGRWAAGGDLDLDGIPDAVVACAAQNVNTVAVLKGKGDGTFSTTSYEVAGNSPTWVGLPDLDRDGKLDLVVVAQAGQVVVRLGTPMIGMAPKFAAPSTIATASFPYAGAIADFNGDGNPDLAVVGAGAQAGASSFLGALGTFGQRRDFPLVASCYDVAAADLDGDGKADLAVAQSTGLTALLGKGGGDFVEPAIALPLAGSNQSVAATDLDGDGKLDLVVASTASGTVAVLRNVSTP